MGGVGHSIRHESKNAIQPGAFYSVSRQTFGCYLWLITCHGSDRIRGSFFARIHGTGRNGSACFWCILYPCRLTVSALVAEIYSKQGEIWLLTLYAKNVADSISGRTLKTIKEEIDG